MFPGVNDPPLPRFDNAYSDLNSGDFQEWQLGFELNVPIGFREGHVAARNAELLLSRERAILRDQQREVVHEVADAVAEVDRAYTVLQTSYNRLAANRDQLGAVQAAYEADKVPLDLYLDAQRRVAEAETDYYLNRTRYTLATKNVHFVKGTLLDYDGVHLGEGLGRARLMLMRPSSRPCHCRCRSTTRRGASPLLAMGRSINMQLTLLHRRLDRRS